MLIEPKMLRTDFFPFPEIGTRRLLLRRIHAGDASAVQFLRSQEAVMKYIDRKRLTSIEEALAFITGINESIDSQNGITWGISMNTQPAILIGHIGFWRLIKEHYRAEVGYLLHPDYWKLGIMKEALLPVIHYGFHQMGLHSIQANIHAENTASARLLVSAGFVKEAHFREDFYFDGRFRDTIIYSLLKS